MTTSEKLVVWIFTDGRKGHESQTRGLVNAIKSISINPRAVETFDLAHSTQLKQLRTMPRPDIILGAGHRTHLPILRARALFGGRSVVLMKPSLPSFLFDLVIVPQHDTCINFGNVRTSIGVINPIVQGRPDPGRGMILIGGISRHFRWDNQRIIRAIDQICTEQPERHWLICDSPRSPRELLHNIEDKPNITKYPWQKTSDTFIANQLIESSANWVTCDSVSMLYEALGTGVPVGVLELESLRTRNKIQQGISELARIGRVQLSRDGLSLDPHHRTDKLINEAERCAKMVLTMVH